MPDRNSHHALTLHLAARTSTGRIRSYNEDAFSIESSGSNVAYGPPDSHLTLTSTAALFGVYDSLGRSPAGCTTSSLAAHAIHAALQPDWPLMTCESLARRLVLAVQAASQRIFTNGQADPSARGLSTRATVAAAVDRHLKLAHVGDTRAYLLRDRQLRQISRDHTLANEPLEPGRLTPEEAAMFDHNKLITRTLGMAGSVEVDVYSLDLAPGDVVLLCTDGVHGLLDDLQIQSILADATDPTECSVALLEAADEAGGYDNETAIVAMAPPPS